MIHSKSASPIRTPQRKKRQTNSGRASSGSARTRQHDVRSPPAEPVPLRYVDTYKREKAQAEMGTMYKKKKGHTIAPDALIPNSTYRTIFKRKEVKTVEIKAFELRLDILSNLQNQDHGKPTWQDDDVEELTELDDPDEPSKPIEEKKPKATLVSRPKLDDEQDNNNKYWTEDTMPGLFKRLQNEPWWKQEKDDKPNLRSMLMYLFEILKLKQTDSYESACYYVVEIFRTFGIEPNSVNQIFAILLNHLTKNSNDRLDICTVRTIAQFMIERKDIIVRLLEYALKCQPKDNFQLETINAIKFITDVNQTEAIDLVLNNMLVVYNAPDDNFSLKMIIKQLESAKKAVPSEVMVSEEGGEEQEKEEEVNQIHPLLKKISEERWFPRSNVTITLDYVVEAILAKLPDATKTLIKTLTTHLIQLQRVIGYSKEQYDQVANAFVSLLAHTDADYRLLAATNLANLGQETKAIDLALLNSFLNDSRVLVRTECCDSLKKLTGITSETILKDCADEISYLQTLPEENFSLQNYLKEKNRVPTPPPMSIQEEEEISANENEQEETLVNEINTDEVLIDEIEREEISAEDIKEVPLLDQIEIKEDVVPATLPLSSQVIEPSVVIEQLPIPVQKETKEVDKAPSVSSIMTFVQPSIRVEINGLPTFASTSTTSKSGLERSTVQTSRSFKSSSSPRKRPSVELKRSITLLPNNTNMWDSYVKQNEIHDKKDELDSPLGYPFVPPSTVIDQDLPNDPIQTMIEEHEGIIHFYRMMSNRRVLVPHKISMENVLSDHSHILLDQFPPSIPRYLMNLSDFDNNQHQLNDVEFTQLLSSLVIRAIEVHKQYEKSSPGMHIPSYPTPLNISPVYLHSLSNFQHSNLLSSSSKLPSIASQRPTTRQFNRMQSNIQARAAKDGINLHKAQSIEGALSNLLKSSQELSKSTIASSITSNQPSSRLTETTHASLLVDILKSQGVTNSESYLQKVIQTYPRFVPILNTRIPAYLVSIIWNDPVTKEIASIFGNKQDRSNLTISSIKRSDTKPSVPTSNDEYMPDAFDYSAVINRTDSKKKFLPTIRGSKMNLPRHVLKFGFREIDTTDISEPSSTFSSDESRFKSRKRRVYMHMLFDHQQENVKNQLQQMVTPDYQTTSFLPIVARPPVCH